jgi:hypothetical protein
VILIAPESAPQIFRPAPVPAKPLRLDWIDQLLLERLADAGSCPTWTLLNAVEAEHPAQDRTRGRLFRLQLWDRLKRLRRLGLLYSVGRNKITASRPAPTTRRQTLRRRRRTVDGLRSFRGVSVVPASSSSEAGRRGFQVHLQMDKWKPAPRALAVEVEKNKRVPAPEDVSTAARQLARLPRRPKRAWSGWINDRTRAYRNMPVKLPGNRNAFVFGVLRGRLVFTLQPGMCPGDPDEAERNWGVVPASSVQVIKNEHAVALGRRKAGVKEQFSPSKIAAARRNGRLPPKAGRRRGRP